ncbi:4'-phosphopantetheinyl transferase superfamily protein [uncultured Cellulomonas sp.]|uniref:4'-phosphopantetheinyl transferase family protein n=1 Tax=uncultured Cellulomonas sp. TaxID=189682 RepID=UPI0028E461ED|nr:4'-phosphopantetheinyl transferase superfamily protein [uncultured Cellulomonas sp.]
MASGSVTVDVWLAAPDAHVTVRQRGSLDEPERERAAGLPDHASHRFVVGRVLLRTVLAARLACEPADVVLSARCRHCGGAHGPVSVLPDRLDGLHVSITRSGPVVGVALSTAGPVGIDVESLSAVAAAPLADVLLSDRERDHGRRRPRYSSRGDLARAWVRKEAALKALRTGLVLAPSSIDLERPPTGIHGVDAVVRDSVAVAVAGLRAGQGNVGAVAVVAPELVGAPDRDRHRAAPGGRLVVRRYRGDVALRW